MRNIPSADLPSGWRLKNDSLVREFRFENFVAAFGFMTQVAMLAEVHEHHPNWSNVYNRVSIALTTHDADNTVTAKDLSLAAAINEIKV